MLKSRNMKESIYELPSTAVNLSVAAAAKSSLRCKINEIKNPQALSWGSGGAIRNILPWRCWKKSTKYEIQNEEYMAWVLGCISDSRHVKAK